MVIAHHHLTDPTVNGFQIWMLLWLLCFRSPMTMLADLAVDLAKVAAAWVPALLVFGAVSKLRHLFGGALFGAVLAVVLAVVASLSGTAPAPMLKGFARVLHFVKGKGTGRPRPRPFEYDVVVPGKLLVGCQPQSEADVEALADAGVVALVSANQEWELHVPSSARVFERVGIKRLHLPTDDYQAPSLADVRRAVGFLLAATESSGGLGYVHCNAGRGRAAVFAATFLLSSGAAQPPTAEAAAALLRARRPVTSKSIARYFSPQGRMVMRWADLLAAGKEPEVTAPSEVRSAD